jgi:hypothetical protein
MYGKYYHENMEYGKIILKYFNFYTVKRITKFKELTISSY